MVGRPFPTRASVTTFSLIFTVDVLWNIYLYTLPSHNLNANYFFTIAYGIIPLIVGALLLYNVFARRVGGEIATALGYLGTGAAAFGLGLTFWTYYNVVAHIPFPHPSVGDAFFLVYPWLLIIGTLRFLRFYTPELRWPVLLEALGVFFIAAVPIYHYFIVPSLGLNLSYLDKLNIYDALIANAALLGLVYLLWRIGGGRLRFVLSLYSWSYLALSAGQFIFQYRTDNNLYWNGEATDSLLLLHVFLFALATVYILDSLLNPLAAEPVTTEQAKTS